MHSNPTQPAVKLTLAGVDHDLVFDFEAIAEAEDLTGRALLTGLRQKDISTPTISLVRAMLFACLHAKRSDLTFDSIKALVTRHNLVEVWGKVLEAWTEGLAERDEVEPTDPTQDQS